ncbi:TRAP-type C4-dicarboxylate transport system, small permease component [[Clostridium] aminophilum]|uniref:TRAP-type C4-dicarboxylate transport system, small permease component n=1 Tax=[Clostridium] aminophilum TaxID=1526 RepID=A0A1I0G7N1_9FIRM|nr:TRAP transporter small permease [[Clostridium] aminophilum]SET65909.1 TRAP-type C4-dicarboxylate transport system, small permease component [[Clostridium] aminophilum]
MKLLKWLNRYVEELFLVTILCSIVIVMLYQIVRRYIFNASLSWSEEFCRYAFIWFIFLALPYSIRLGSELRMDAVISALPSKANRTLKLVLTVASLLFTAFLFFQSVTAVQESVIAGEISTGLHLPKQYIYLSMPVGFGLAVIRYIQVILPQVTHREKEA